MAKKKREEAGDGQVPQTVAIGREVAARVPGKNPATGQEQGQLVRHPEGSNGGVSRGPDLKPRNMMRAILLKAYSDEGYVAEVLAPGQPKPKVSWRKRKKVRHAAVHNAARAVQRILYDAADGLRRRRRHDRRLRAADSGAANDPRRDAARQGRAEEQRRTLRPALHPPAAGPARQLGSGRRAAGVRGRDGPGGGRSGRLRTQHQGAVVLADFGGTRDDSAGERSRAECHAIAADELVPSLDETGGIDERRYELALTSMRLQTRHRVAVSTTNPGEVDT